ncbi:hypothetical protein HY496_02030 [Candidatus Woesearchaeota archaeon]|nr:hypothetical protein [Candidatus Woesearchaeota archaeon]
MIIKKWRRVKFGILYLCLGAIGGLLGGIAVKQHAQGQPEAVDAVTQLCEITAYSSLDDGLKPGDKGFDVQFCGGKPIPDYTIACDPKFWSLQFDLPWEDKWSKRPLKKEDQEQAALAPVFWKLIFLIEDQYGKLHPAVPRDVGGAVKNSTLDVYKGYTPEAQKEAKKFGRQYRKVYVMKKTG